MFHLDYDDSDNGIEDEYEDVMKDLSPFKEELGDQTGKSQSNPFTLAD